MGVDVSTRFNIFPESIAGGSLTILTILRVYLRVSSLYL